MAVAAVIKARDATSLKRAIVELTFSGTYTTGGEATTLGFLKDLSWTVVHAMLTGGTAAGSAVNGVQAVYNHSTNKIQLYRVDQVDDTLEELPNGTALDQVTRVEFVGLGNS